MKRLKKRMCVEDILNKPQEQGFLYRFELEYSYDTSNLRCDEYKIISKTPKGCWIVPLWCIEQDYKKFRKFVLDKGTKNLHIIPETKH
jgi:hypothetical protein